MHNFPCLSLDHEAICLRQLHAQVKLKALLCSRPCLKPVWVRSSVAMHIYACMCWPVTMRSVAQETSTRIALSARLALAISPARGHSRSHVHEVLGRMHDLLASPASFVVDSSSHPTLHASIFDSADCPKRTWHLERVCTCLCHGQHRLRIHVRAKQLLHVQCLRLCDRLSACFDRYCKGWHLCWQVFTMRRHGPQQGPALLAKQRRPRLPGVVRNR